MFFFPITLLTLALVGAVIYYNKGKITFTFLANNFIFFGSVIISFIAISVILLLSCDLITRLFKSFLQSESNYYWYINSISSLIIAIPVYFVLNNVMKQEKRKASRDVELTAIFNKILFMYGIAVCFICFCSGILALNEFVRDMLHFIFFNEAGDSKRYVSRVSYLYTAASSLLYIVFVVAPISYFQFQSVNKIKKEVGVNDKTS